jgi:hypothetical protein
MATYVYIATSGSYSSYTILGVFSSKEIAEEFSRAFPDASIDAFELDAKSPYPPGKKAYRVAFRKTGTSEMHVIQTDPDLVLQLSGNVRPWDEDFVAVWCWADDEQHACKIASEQRTQWTASGSPMPQRLVQ